MKRNIQQLKDLINNISSVYSATFIFRIKNNDSEFERLNNFIDEVASSNPGFLGKEKWSNEEENKRSIVYYWDSLIALKKFSNHPDHQKAKRNYKKWYNGYEIIISEVLKFKTDDGLLKKWAFRLHQREKPLTFSDGWVVNCLKKQYSIMESLKSLILNKNG